MKTTEEKNRLIDEFMGVDGILIDMGLYTPLKYHTSLDYLMPVIKKIKELKVDTIYKNFVYRSIGFIEDVEKYVDEVVQFIEWYNEDICKRIL